MIREGPEGLPVERRPEPAANEEFAEGLNRRDTLGRNGWDPYEVWRSRVRTPSKARTRNDRPRDSRR